MASFDLSSRFPDLQPLESLPVVRSYNGFGFLLYGHRDHDAETNTYVRTHCFCLLYFPILALGAYRLMDMRGGWYIFGRVPLSRLAKAWNVLFPLGLLALLGGLGGNYYLHSPGYRARCKFAEADRLAAAGHPGKAAQLCLDVAQENLDFATPATEKVARLLEGPLDRVDPEEAAGVFEVAVEMRQYRGAVTNLHERGMTLVNQLSEGNPRAALVLEPLAPVAPDAKAFDALLLQLLEHWVKQQPDDPDGASHLAVAYEARQQLSKCEALLAPHEQRLGNREGARILGQLYSQQDKLDQAYALLIAYSEERLKKLHAAEGAYTEAAQKKQKDLLARLQKGDVPDFPYDRYDKAGKEQRQVIVMEYVGSKLKDDPELKRLQSALAREERVVPAALDLGIVTLRRAQSLVDPARRAELEKAEKTFLAVRGVAGETDSYRLSLGQVYYWLGKHDEGRKQFDDVLAAHQRDVDYLLAVAELLREVGASAEARAMTEKAYNAAADEEKKQRAAADRALVYEDLDDEITWLKRAKTADPHVKAWLSTAQGNKALAEGKEDEAATHLREAIDAYARLPVDASSLNNGAIAYFSLFSVTGDPEPLNRGMEMIEKAVALKPSDSILLMNAGRTLLEVGVRDVIGSAIDLKALRMRGSLDLLPFLYQDQAGRDRLIARVRENPRVAKGAAFCDRAVVLSPRRPEPYHVLAEYHHFTHNVEGLRGLLRRLNEVELDTADGVRRSVDYFTGKDDEKTRKDLQTALQREQALVATLRQGLKGVEEVRRGPRAVTFAVAATHLVRYKQGLDVLGVPTNADEIVSLAKEAHDAAPSEATQQTLTTALFVRAGKALTKQEPGYAALAQRGQRSLGANYLIPWLLGNPGAARDHCLANPDVQRGIQLLREGNKTFPDEPSAWTWAFLRASHPDEGAQLAAAVKANEIGTLDREIQRVSPADTGTALRTFWALQLAGKEAEGFEVLKRCAALGVPLPVEGK